MAMSRPMLTLETKCGTTTMESDVFGYLKENLETGKTKVRLTHGAPSVDVLLPALVLEEHSGLG